MKTNYRPRSNSPYRRNVRRLLIIFVCVGLLVFLLRGPLQKLASPLWQARAAVLGGFANLHALISSKVALENENAALRAQVASYDNLILACRATESSRDDLLATYGRSATSTGVAATVLVRPPETPYDLVELDAGMKQGVSVGNTVRLPEGEALGIISEVSELTAKATLYTSSGTKIGAVLERGAIPLILTGRGGGNFSAELPREVAVEVGDKILTADLRPTLIGVVGQISGVATDAFRGILIKGAANLQTLHYVLITP